MKNKWIKLVGLLFICCITAFGGVACKEDEHEPVHEHEYETVVTAPTCMEQGFTTYTCSCGDTYIDTYVSAVGHEFTNYVFNNDATCLTDGTETATCNHTGCVETDTRTEENSALGHEFTNYISDNNATCEKDGTETATCAHTGCAETDTRTKEDSALGHSFANYVSDNNATCEKDGTETAKCVHTGCKETDTRTKEDSALGHSFTIYVSDNNATCEKDGTETATCAHTGCVETDTRTKEDSALGHEFTNYVSDNNATYEKDGTKTAKCNHGCGKTDTVADIGSMLVKNTLTFKTLTVNNTNVYGKVSNTTETFSFINEVVTSGKTKYTVSIDIYGIQQVASKTIPLEIGDNTVYITETVDGEPINVYTVTVRRRPTYEITFETNGGTAVETQTVEEDYYATEPETTRTGYTFTGWSYDFKQPITGNTTVSASWTANTDTAYKVEYYLQNLEDNGYTLQETNDLAGTTDTTAAAEIKTFEHFTYDEGASSVSGNIDGDGSRVLSVYYTRDSYTIVVNGNNEKAGTSTNVNGSYLFEQEFTLTATTNAGYTWLGWYEGETLVGEAPEFTFTAERNVTYTASWSTNTDTAYKVEYYLQNLEDDGYTLQATNDLAGTTDTTATATIKEYAHFTYNASKSTISGNINGDGNRVLSVYYTRDMYTLSINDSSVGKITNAGTYKYGTQLSSVATVYLGYDLGWYSGEELLSEDTEYTFTVEKNVTAKIALKAEMENFFFTSTETTCSITGLKDKKVTELVVPDYVTSIGEGAFSKCSYLESITLPFVGAEAGKTSTDNSQYPFGYIFGKDSYTGGTETLQKHYGYETFWPSSDTYYIPTTLKSVTVTGGNIPYGAFYNCGNLTSLTIPDSVTSIGYDAFEGCSSLTGVYITDIAAWCKISFGSNPLYNAKNLYLNGALVTELTIPDGMTSIGYNAFNGCTSLTSIKLPDSVTSIGYDAFYKCNSLTGVYITDIAAWCKISFGNDFSNPLYYAKNLYLNGALVTELTIPDGMTSIGYNAFNGCTSLTSIKLPDSVTSIEGAFKGCSSLTSIKIPESVTSIGYGAFSGCYSLTSIEIPDSVTHIAEGAFGRCYSLTSIEIPDSVTSIGEGAFYNCSSLTSITLPFIGAYAGRTSSSIYQYPFGYIFGPNGGGTKTEQKYYGSSTSSTTSAFYYIPTALKSVTVTGGNILYGAFYNCNSLASITLGDGVTSIDTNAFYGCTGLTTVVIGNGVTSIVESTFEGCTSLTSITIPDSVTSIGYNAFRDCTSLTSITIPDSVTSIGNYAFQDCTALTDIYYNATECADLSSYNYVFAYAGISGDGITVTVGANVKYIPAFLFSPRSAAGVLQVQLISVIFEENSVCETIGEYAFNGCSSLTSVTIPNSVTSIDSHAFFGCSSLTSISIPDSVTSIGYAAFRGCSSLTSVTIPNSVTSIGDEAFYGCSSLTSITIPDSVTSIGYKAFNGCSSLTGVYITDIAAWCKISFGSNPLYNAKKLYLNGALVTELTIPDSVTSIGYGAFYNCSRLTSVTIPNSVTSIGGSAFSGCSSLTNVKIPNSVTSIDGFAFSGCSSLTGVYITDIAAWCKISFGSNPLYNAKNLYLNGALVTELTIPDSVTHIAEGAFGRCYSLTSIEIPDSVTSIGSYAFNGCSSLTSIIVDKNNTEYQSIDGNLYSKDGKTLIQYAIGKRDTSFIIPDSVTSIGSSAFYKCSSLTSITIPDSVTSIGSSAFYDCSSLTSITFEGTTGQWYAISKDSMWKDNVPATEVVCSNGTIYL